MTQNDKAGTSTNYCDDNWSNSEIPKIFDRQDQNLGNYVNQELHKYFQKSLGDRKNLSKHTLQGWLST